MNTSRPALAWFLLATSGGAQCPDWASNFGPAPSGDGLDGRVASLATFDDGHGARLYASGVFTHAGSTLAPLVARWDGSQWTALDPTAFGPGSYVVQLVACDFDSGPRLIAAGDFVLTTATGEVVHGIAAWDGTSWHGTGGPGVPWIDHAQFYDQGTGAPRALYTWSLNGFVYTDAFRYDGAHWSYVGEFADTPFLVSCVADAGAGALVYLTRGIGNMVTFDGVGYGPMTSPSGLYGGCDVDALAAFDAGTGSQLYAAGRIGGNRGFVARWNGTAWTDVGGVVSHGAIQAVVGGLHVHDFGSGPSLVACGQFTSIGGTPANDIAVFDGAGWSALGSGLDVSLEPRSDGLASFDSGDGAGPSLFVGAEFDVAGGQPAQNIARYRPCGGPTTLFCFGDGSATACPCGNASAVGAGVGCLNSLGTGGSLRTSGQASLAHDTLVLHGAGMTNSSALYFQGANVAAGGSGYVFGDGVKCVAGPFARLLTKFNSGGASSYPESGDPPISLRGSIGGPGTRHYQVHYRNPAPFCTSETFNYSNGIGVVWSP